MTALRSKTLNFRPISNKRHGLGVFSLAGLIGLSGCSSVTGNPVVSLLRIVDASSNSNGIDVYQGSGALAYNLGLGTITSYVPVIPGTYNISVDAAGSKTQLANVLGSFGPNAQYTVVVGDNSTVLGETVLKDQSTPAPSGQVALRFVHQSSAGGAVDIYLIPNGSTISQVKPILTGVTFGTNTGYLNEPAGVYTLAAVPTGTVPSATTATSYSGSAVSYGSGTARTILLINQPLLTTPGIQVVVADDYDPATSTS